MPRYKLRTLLILLAVLPPVLAGLWLFAPVLSVFAQLLGYLVVPTLIVALPTLAAFVSWRVRST